MRIGSFFSTLMIALIALGFFLADALHLRESLKTQQREIQRLTIALQNSEKEKQSILIALQSSEQEKQSTLITLHDTGQKLQACRQEAGLANQRIVQLTNENTVLKQEINSAHPASQSMNSVGAPVPQPAPVTRARAASLLTFVGMGVGSVLTLAWKSVQRKSFSRGRTNKKGSYIYLSHAEIRELANRRRTATKTEPSHSDG